MGDVRVLDRGEGSHNAGSAIHRDGLHGNVVTEHRVETLRLNRGRVAEYRSVGRQYRTVRRTGEVHRGTPGGRTICRHGHGGTDTGVGRAVEAPIQIRHVHRTIHLAHGDGRFELVSLGAVLV